MHSGSQTQSGAVGDVRLLTPEVHSDERGHFFEAYNAASLESLLGAKITFVQDNQSSSHKGVLRGLHYQLEPKAQGKLVRVVKGAVLDVAVDIRRSSPEFGTWLAYELSEENFKQLWIPPGFAHGFLALTDRADLLYKVTEYYSPEHERCIRWNDPDIGIDWGLEMSPMLSNTDSSAPYLRDAQVFT